MGFFDRFFKKGNADNQGEKGFKLYQGSGCCDVCNKSVNPGEAYMVPTNVFYNSKKYRAWLSNNPMVSLVGSVDAFIAHARSMDNSSHSAVCTDCIHMFK